jgi:restriction modification system DNA specificity domain protein
MSKIKKVPEIRFKGYTDAWKQRKLGDVKDVRDGTHDSPKYIPTGYPLVTSKNLTENGLDYSDISYISEDDFLAINKRSKVEIGDIIFGMIGTIGNPVLVKSEGFAIKNVALLKNNGIINNSFLIHLLKSPIFTKYIKLENAGGTQKFLGLSQIRNFECLIPNEAEQVLLGDFFIAVDNLITLHQRKYDQVVNFKKAMLEKMFPKNGSDTPEIRFKGYTDAWEQRELGTMITVHPSKDLTVEAIESEGTSIVVQQGDSPILGYSNAEGFEGYINVTLFGDHTVSLYKPQLPFVVATDGVKILSSSILHHQYFYTVLEKYKPIPQGYKRHFSILKEQIANITVNKDEQKKIGEIFEIIDDLITLHQRKLQQLKHIKKAMLEKMFV